MIVMVVVKLPPLFVTTPFTYRHHERDKKNTKKGRKQEKKNKK
jgi:hypothetical protein